MNQIYEAEQNPLLNDEYPNMIILSALPFIR